MKFEPAAGFFQLSQRWGFFGSRYWMMVGAIAALYFGAAKFGLSLAFVNQQVTAVWPPTGVGLVALVLLGPRMWPGIWLGAFVINAIAGTPLTAIGLATGNTLEAVAGAFLLRLFGFKPALERLQDVCGLIGFAALLSTILSATIGVISLCLGGMPWANFGKVWFVWWLGDAMGDMIVAPFLFGWMIRPRIEWRGWRLAEFAALYATLGIVSSLALSGRLLSVPHYSTEYLVFPIIIWAAFRFGQRETATAIMVVAGMAVWGAIHDVGPFSVGDLNERLNMLVIFMGVTAVTAMALGAVMAERKRFDADLQQSRDQLELRVEQRTVELAHANIALKFEIAERRKNEEELRELNATLEARVRTRTADLTRANDDRQLALESLEVQRKQAVEASRAKDVFLASLSHELRTPLNPALLLASDGAENPAYPGEVRETFASIANQIAVEARLIDDLLDLTKISRGIIKIERRISDLHAIVESSATIVRPDFAQKNLALILSLKAERHWGNVDAVRLQQVICNLLQNAAKFTDSGGRVTLSTENQGSDISIAVTDTGVGMSALDLRRCFEAFAQGDHKRGGLGLGLAITRGIVETHGGTISAASEGVGRGSSMCVTLATSDETPPRDGLPPASGRNEKVDFLPKVLLVEDHAASRVALERLLNQRGFQVTCAGMVAEAVAAATTTKFDLLIADIGLPDGDGYLLRQKLDGHLPPVSIAITGYGMEEDIRRMREAGFSAHLIKPVTIDKLDAVLAEAKKIWRT